MSQSELRRPDRRWMIVGIVLGGTLGYLPVYLPEPLDRRVICSAGGGCIGLMIPPLSIYGKLVLLKNTSRLIRVCLGCAALGTLIGFLFSLTDYPLPEELPIFSACFGIAAGVVISEILLKSAEAQYQKRLEEEEGLYS